ncbi:MAG: endonuclease [Proteobacteria bacterium]|nr:MAG: endonuclease [Pseudomonadota bacterium]
MRDFATDPRWLAINSATIKSWPLALQIEGCARAGITGIAPWREGVGELGTARTRELLRTHGMAVTCYCRGGFFTAPDEAGRRAAIDDNLRAIDEAAEIGARCVVLVAGGLPVGSKDLTGARQQVHDGIAAVLPHARAAKMPLAIEPLHPMTAADRCVVSTLDQALDLCDALGDGTGVALDVYHVWWDPVLNAAIARAGRRILTYHVCDWLVPTVDLVLDRGMMGDGIIDLRAIRAMVEAAGYAGHCDVEIFSARNWWKRDPAEVLQVCAERYRNVV